MLALRLTEREPLYLGADIVVTVLGIDGNEVRLGIKAPESIPIHRDHARLLEALRALQVASSARPGRATNATAAKG